MSPKVIVDNISDHPEEIALTVHGNEILYYLIYGYAAVEKRVSLKLEGEGAQAYILGILIGHEGTCGLHTLQEHRAPNTKSDLLIRTVLRGNASFSYDGKIIIEKRAQRSNAYQRNENILLSPYARVETKPELEILANDVRCTHGATVGKLNEEEIFYLQSRGVSKKGAERLIVEGFIGEVVARMPDVKIRDNVYGRVMEELDWNI